MNLTRKIKRLLLAVLVLPAILPAAQSAELSRGYPERQVRIINPWNAGSATDVSARQLAQRLTQETGQNVIVENRPGIGGIIGTQEITRAPADGYSMLLTSNAHIANQFLVAKLPYDPLEDFTPVAGVNKAVLILVVRPGLGVKTVAELIALAKQQPGKLSYGEGSSTGRVGLELLKTMTGIDVLHVPYKSANQAMIDLIGNQIDMMIIDTTNGVKGIESGKLVGLAVTSAERLPLLPNLPSMSEAGVKGYEMIGWTGVWVRKGTSPEIVARLNGWINAFNASNRASQEAKGLGVFNLSVSEIDQFIRNDVQRWRTVTRAAGIKPQ